MDGENCGTVGKFGTAMYYDVKCTKSLWGSHVVVYLTTSDTVTQLIICEIEVYEGLCAVTQLIICEIEVYEGLCFFTYLFGIYLVRYYLDPELCHAHYKI